MTTIVVEVIGVLTAWVFVGYLIWRWGPGLRKREVFCPKLKARAEILAEQREAEFACLRIADVRTCSLIPSSIVTCGKECLAHR